MPFTSRPSERAFRNGSITAIFSPLVESLDVGRGERDLRPPAALLDEGADRREFEIGLLRASATPSAVRGPGPTEIANATASTLPARSLSRSVRE